MNQVYRPSLWLWSLHHQRQAAIRTHLLQWIYIRFVKKTLQGLVANDSWNSITFFPVPSSDFTSLSSMELDLDGWCWKEHLNQIFKWSGTDNWLNSKARKECFITSVFYKIFNYYCEILSLQCLRISWWIPLGFLLTNSLQVLWTFKLYRIFTLVFSPGIIFRLFLTVFHQATQSAFFTIVAAWWNYQESSFFCNVNVTKRSRQKMVKAVLALQFQLDQIDTLNANRSVRRYLPLAEKVSRCPS